MIGLTFYPNLPGQKHLKDVNFVVNPLLNHTVPLTNVAGKELVYFLYTGHVRPTANAQELLPAAAMYEIHELTDYCVQVNFKYFLLA